MMRNSEASNVAGAAPATVGAAATQALRHHCRNPRCRSKLSAPVSNPREAFCARGCHSSFYRKRCVACEQPMQRKRESQQLCGRRQCESQFKALKAHFMLGRYHPSSAAVEASRNPIKPGTFSPLKTDRAWRQVAGPELSDRQLRLATTDANAVERSNRTINRQHWRAAGTAALIQRDTMPVNIVGGYKFPNAPQIELMAGDPQSPHPTLAIADGDDLPAFLDRRPGGQEVTHDDAAGPFPSRTFAAIAAHTRRGKRPCR